MNTNFEVVKNAATLKAMQRLGKVQFCADTLKKIEGLYSSKKFTCYYVNSADTNFEYKGQIYTEKYFDGCFYPYVVKIIEK